jgi:hypothetical protein
LNDRSYSYKRDCKTLSVFAGINSKMQKENAIDYTVFERSRIECAELQNTAVENRCDVLHVRTVKELFKELGYNNKQKRYWNAEDGTICNHCKTPFRAHINIPESMLRMVKNDPIICGHCLVDKLERVGIVQYTIGEYDAKQ